MRRRYMVIEHFRQGGAEPIYERLRDRGRLAPEGLRYVDSWVRSDLRCCYQLVEVDEQALLQQWIERWMDLIDFEVHEVIDTQEAARRVLPR